MQRNPVDTQIIFETAVVCSEWVNYSFVKIVKLNSYLMRPGLFLLIFGINYNLIYKILLKIKFLNKYEKLFCWFCETNTRKLF